MKQILICIFVYFHFHTMHGQTFKKVNNSKEDQASGVLLKYNYSFYETRGYLELYRNDSFFFREKSMGNNIYSTGTWKRNGDTIILKSSIQAENVPIKVTYSYNPTKKGSIIFDTVKNLSNQPLIESMVCVNEDSIKCIPLWVCPYDYSSIRRIKLQVEYGVSSKWVTVPANKNYNLITITILTNLYLAGYEPYNKKFKISRNLLREIK